MDDILFSELSGNGGHIGKIELNRPHVLNALNETMCILMSQKLKAWAADPQIKAVIIRGKGDRAFCAGGDIKRLYEHRNQPHDQLSSFFKNEYAMNREIAHFPKPYISFLNGITMGGGAGISIHGSHRIATEKLLFAMPETAIGFFPDIGATYFLNRCCKKTGWYLGLTGNSIPAGDAYALNLANHFVKQDRLEDLEQALITTKFSNSNFDEVTHVIKKFEGTPDASTLIKHKTEIDFCFSKNSIEEIIVALKNQSDPFFKTVITTLESRSPTSLKVTLEHFKRSEHKNIDHVLNCDYALAKKFLAVHDFYEGIRAMLVDKDKSPHWDPASLQAVTPEFVAGFFE